MSSFKHAGYTWLLAQLIHPVVFCSFVLIKEGSFPVEIVPLVFGISLLASLPSLFVSSLLLHACRQLIWPIAAKAVLWLTMVLLLVVVNYYGLMLLIGAENLSAEEVQLIVPALLATMLSILMRIDQLTNFLNLKIATHENNLV